MCIFAQSIKTIKTNGKLRMGKRNELCRNGV